MRKIDVVDSSIFVFRVWRPAVWLAGSQPTQVQSDKEKKCHKKNILRPFNNFLLENKLKYLLISFGMMDDIKMWADCWQRLASVRICHLEIRSSINMKVWLFLSWIWVFCVCCRFLLEGRGLSLSHATPECQHETNLRSSEQSS